MNEFYKLIRYDDILNLELKGADLEDFEQGLTGAFEEYRELLSRGEDVRLQTFVATEHLAELEYFLLHGFYISNTMLVMERDLREPVDKEDADIPVEISEYEVEKNGLKEYLKANGLGFGKSDPEAMIREQLSLPESRIYVATRDGKIVSSVTVWKSDGDEGTYCTENVFTIPKYREKHIALHLMTDILNKLYESGACKARLTVYGDDAAAIAMYLGMGFTVSSAKYELLY